MRINSRKDLERLIDGQWETEASWEDVRRVVVSEILSMNGCPAYGTDWSEFWDDLDEDLALIVCAADDYVLGHYAQMEERILDSSAEQIQRLFATRVDEGDFVTLTETDDEEIDEVLEWKGHDVLRRFDGGLVLSKEDIFGQRPKYWVHGSANEWAGLSVEITSGDVA
jgi:hypothetical protein